MKTFTADRIFRLLLGTVSVLLAAWLLYTYSNLVAYAIIAMLLTYMLDPIVNRIEAAGVNRTLGITLTLASLLLVLVWISTSIFPIIANQMIQLAQQFNIENIQMIARKVEASVNQNLPFIPDGFLQDSFTRIFNDLFNVGTLPAALSNVIGVFTNIFSAVLIIPFATFFFLKDGSYLRRQMLRLVPNKYFETTLSLIDKIESRLGVYLRGVLLQSIIVAVTSWITLSLVGLTNALSVGIAVGIANTIPYFGPIIGYILSVIVSILETGDFSLVLPCMLAILAVQILDNVVLQPFIFSRSADIHPVAILFIIMIGAETAGILGMLVAIPLATIIKITVNQINWSVHNYHIFTSNA